MNADIFCATAALIFHQFHRQMYTGSQRTVMPNLCPEWITVPPSTGALASFVNWATFHYTLNTLETLLKLQHNWFRLLSVIPVWVRTCLHCKGQQLFRKFNSLWELGTQYFVFKAEMMFRQEAFHESAFDILFQAAALVHCAQHLWRWLQSPRRLPRAFLDFEIVPKLWPCQSTLLEFVSWEDGLSCFVLQTLQTVPELCDHLQEQADAEEPRDAVLGSLKSMDRTPEA